MTVPVERAIMIVAQTVMIPSQTAAAATSMHTAPANGQRCTCVCAAAAGNDDAGC